MNDRVLPRHDVVLLGAGHTNAHILRMWRMKPLPDAQLTCVSNFSVATYSGMLPGALAALYPQEQMEIDLVRLCAAVGARLIVADFAAVDPEQRQVVFYDRPSIPFDVLSIGIGSVPIADRIPLDETVVKIKPMQTFLARLEARLAEVAARRPARLSVAVVGAGVGGVEITMGLPHRLQDHFPETPIEITLLNGSDEVAAGTSPRTQRRVRGELTKRGVRLLLGQRVTEVAGGGIALEDGQHIPADLVLWATGANAPPALAGVPLPKDERGFLLTHSTLQSTGCEAVFAVGDTGTLVGSDVPKAGVYAVRQGPVLWKNLGRYLAGRDLVEYKPQTHFLKLLNLGNHRAIAEYRGFTARGVLPWKLKDAIDRRFMDKYQDYEPMEMAAEPKPAEPAKMRCAGCGGKVSGTVLSHVLDRLEIRSNESVLLGLEHPDDAAIIQPVKGRPITVTADFFQPPLDDPYLSGRIAALNSASDLFALGSRPIAALALATLLPGRPRKQEQLLYELLAGSLYEFDRMGAALVGGHTIEGPQNMIGFTMLADQGSDKPLTKAGLRSGDVLILTKPLGTGVLLVAHMQAACRAAWMETLLESMLLSNQLAAELVDEFDIAAVTDVTGFGLAGHLLEMLRASQLACDLQLESLPLLPGAATLSEQGIESTLAPANRAAETEIRASESLRTRPHYSLLFDPQTSGGLLLGVRQEDTPDVLKRLSGQSDVVAAVVGTVRELQGEQPYLQLR